MYATLDELRGRMEMPDGVDDAVMEAVLEAVSQAIDDHCGRSFGQTTDTRTYTADGVDACDVDDLVSISALATDDNVTRTYSSAWSAGEYDLEPANATQRGRPYRRIEATGGRAFPTIRRGVRVTGVFGWPAVPATVREAALLWAARLFKRKDAPFGVAGPSEMGQMTSIPRMDPDVEMLLRPYRLFRVGAA